jgi:uncharacterized cupredoxin-like copper-binding protein
MGSGGAKTRSRASLGSVAVAFILITGSACSSLAPPGQGSAVAVTLKDYRISLAVAMIPGGVVTFDIHNRGPSTHEFVVFKTDRAGNQLPLGADGLTVDEDSPFLRNVGEVAEVDIGSSRTLSLPLAPGRYVFACNIEGHYLGGMYSVVTVH